MRKLLIVDDAVMNRMILRKILSEEYEIFEADNGLAALDILKQEGDGISAVLLDIAMPVMDGYTMLERMQETPALSKIPVLITTGNSEESAELRALSLGANDYITKPYNSAIIKHRIRNTIKLRETAAMVNALQRDELTGLYNRNAFFAKTEKIIAEHEPGTFVMACFNVINFKVINDQYGSAKGDEVLKFIADTFARAFEPMCGICSRITADKFAVLYPCKYMASREITELRNAVAQLDGSIRPIDFSIGRYIINDLSLPVSAMYDRAALAVEEAKSRFDVKVAYYDESMRESILREQEIVDEMKTALTAGQFEAWLQPQYNHSSGALIGAEALVRWRHPVKGLIPPYIFITVFERNGFIYEMDKNVWEQACILLRKWIDEGRTPLPVSVNVSRQDILRDDFLKIITGLVEKYGIPLDLLRLEITETAFANSIKDIICVVKQLVDYGFIIEIDDFGSGYSSLNTLKNVPANILKLDMRFLEDSENSSRGGNILESIVRMAKWLGMPVIAEGVETMAQADYLKSIGCNYVQGYLYAKPMPVADYEALMSGSGKEDKMATLETVQTLDNNMFWDPNSMDTLIFNSYVGGACVFEYHNRCIEMLRVNDKYARAIGHDGMTSEEAITLEWADYIDPESRILLRSAIEKSIETRDEVTGEYTFVGLSGDNVKTYLRVTLRVIASVGDRYLIYCTNENITAQHVAEEKERNITSQMQAIMDNVNCGITAIVMHEGHRVEYIFMNDKYFELFGYTRRQFCDEVTDPFSPIHPDDLEDVLQKLDSLQNIGDTVTLEYRAHRRDGKKIRLRDIVSLINLVGVNAPVQISMFTDITEGGNEGMGNALS